MRPLLARLALACLALARLVSTLLVARPRGACVLLLTILALTACAPNPAYYTSARPQYRPQIHSNGTQGAPSSLAPSSLVTAPGGGPGAVSGSNGHVAILAPLTGANAERGETLVHAAQLALDVPGGPTLDVIDTQSTPQGAAVAAQTAISQGASLILGPLTAGETAAAAGPATQAGVAMLAFTSDNAQARPGVWVMGLTPIQQVRRLVTAAVAQGHGRFAALLPSSEFGNAMADALSRATSEAGDGTPDIRHVDGSLRTANSAVRDISAYASRRGPLDAQIKAARASGTPEGRQRAVELSRQSIPPPPFNALLLADTGDELANLASMLPYYDVDAPAVRILGPALWANPASRRGAGLAGAWYAAPDPAGRTEFSQLYEEKYGAPAPGLADLAYDAASIARAVSRDGGFRPDSIARPEGFAGVNGVLALQADGTVRRGLAVFQIERGGARMVEPAPDSATAPGS